MGRSRTDPNSDALSSVKLFVASTGYPYKPSWAPNNPVVIVAGGASEAPCYVNKKGHICSRHLPVFQSLLREGHDDIFLVDLSLVAPPETWREEVDKPGRVTRMLAKWLGKFNPRNATFITYGDDGVLLHAALEMVEGTVHSLAERLILVGEGTSIKYRAQQLGEAFKVDLVRPALKALRGAVAKARGHTLGSEIELGDLFVCAVDFEMDPELKHLKQTSHDVMASALAADRPLDFNLEIPVSGGASRLTIDRLDFGMTIDGMRAQVLQVSDAGDVVRLMLADPHASVEALVPKGLQKDCGHGAMICVSGRVVAIVGRMLVMVEHVEPSNGFRRDYKAVRAGQRNMSERDQRIGCIIVRGSKCALARKDDRFEIPVAVPRGCESQTGTAVRSAMEACKIHAEEFAMLHDVPPVVVYDVPEKTAKKSAVGSPVSTATKLTVFAAVATSPAPEVDSCCGTCSPLESTDPYEWCSCEEALTLLTTEAERGCLLKLVQSIAEAAHAGLLADNMEAATTGFRPALPAAMNDLGLNQSLAIMAAEVRAIANDSTVCQPVIGAPAAFDRNRAMKRAVKAAKIGGSGTCCPGGKCDKKGCC